MDTRDVLRREIERMEGQLEQLRFRSNGQKFLYPPDAPRLDYSEADYKDAYTVWYDWLSCLEDPIATVLEIGAQNNSIKQHPLGFKVVYLSPFPQTLEDGSY